MARILGLGKGERQGGGGKAENTTDVARGGIVGNGSRRREWCLLRERNGSVWRGTGGRVRQRGGRRGCEPTRAKLIAQAPRKRKGDWERSHDGLQRGKTVRVQRKGDLKGLGGPARGLGGSSRREERVTGRR